MPTRKGILLVLLAMCLVVAVTVIPDKFGEGYQRYLAGDVVLLLVVLLYFTKWLRPGTAQSKADRFNIPPGAATRRLINLAKAAIGEAEPEKSLQHLSGLKVSALDTQVVALNGRYSEYRRNSRLGLLSTREETLISNQIKHDILDLIKALEDELAIGSENYKIIKEYLKKRYTNRLGQKLAKRQPVNLRRIPSKRNATCNPNLPHPHPAKTTSRPTPFQEPGGCVLRGEEPALTGQCIRGTTCRQKPTDSAR